MHAWLIAFTGGVLIGLSATALLWSTGRIAGISGILGGVLAPPRDGLAWRLAFLLGLVGVGGALLMVMPQAQPSRVGVSPLLLGAGGLLVGFGTRLGNGCTSGHGVCGLGLRSRRSMAAVGVFMASAMLVTFMVRHVWGGA